MAGKSISEGQMKRIPLTIAISDYDHFRDFRYGEVRHRYRAAVADARPARDFSRFAAGREWHVSEMSFAKFSAQATAPDADIIGLPVFASRVFRLPRSTSTGSRHQERRGPQGQARRAARMGADRSGLFARLAAARG